MGKVMWLGSLGRSLRLVWVLGLLLAAWPAWAEKRVALLIGNSVYEHANALPNPVNDVELLAQTLSAGPLGFEVETYTDLTQAEMARAVFDFLRSTEDADLTLFFFAGHGLQYEEENYLLGVEARLETPFALTSEALALNDLIDMIRSDQRTALLFIDACRNNPLARSFYAATYGSTRAATTRGLARIDLPPGEDGGIMLAFSASPGQVAVDGPERGNSPFAQALASHIQTPGVEVLSVMRRVMRDVRAETASRPEPQVPIFTADLVDEIYLAALPDPNPVEVAAEPLVQGPEAAPSEPELAALEAAIAINTAEAWDFFLRLYPESSYATQARQERDRLRAAAASAEMPQVPTPETGSDRAQEDAAFLGSAQEFASQGRSCEALRALHSEQADILRQEWIETTSQAIDAGNEEQCLEYYQQASGEIVELNQGQGTMAGPEQTQADVSAPSERQPSTQASMLTAAELAAQGESCEALRTLHTEQVDLLRQEWIETTSQAINAGNREQCLQYYEQAAAEIGQLAKGTGLSEVSETSPTVQDLLEAADQGDAEAQVSLGLIYRHGTGVPQDFAEAAKWYQLAADQGHAAAVRGLWSLGMLYANGSGVPQDLERAAELILRTYRQGDSFFQSQLVTRQAANVPDDLRREIQRTLQEQGFYDGAIDGDFGQGTLAALDAYARSSSEATE